MKRLTLGCVLLLSLVVLFAAVALADSASYTPPAEKGDIYTVIKYKATYGIPEKTKVTVKWGSYNQTKTVSPPKINAPVPEGYVLKLKHKKADSIDLSVTTDGTIKSGPTQGGPPPEWSNKAYKQESW